MQINHFMLSALFTAVTTFLLGIFVLLGGRWKRSLYVKFALYSFSITIWCACVSVYTPDFNDVDLIWGKMLHVGAILIPVFFVQYVSEFLKLDNRKLRGIVNALGGLLIVTDLFTELIVNGTVNTAHYSYPKPGPLYPYVFLFFIYCTLYGIYKLAAAYIHEKSVQKRKIGYLLFGSIFGYLGGLKNFMIVAGIELFPIYPYGTYAIPVYTLIVAYAIIRHQLMDIEVIIKKTLVFTGLFAVSYTVFASVAYLGTELFENFTRNRWVAMIPSVLVIVVILRPLENFLRNITDKYLFQKKYDYKQLLKTFSDEVLTVLDLNRLIHLTVNNLADIMKLDNAAILLKDSDKGGYSMAGAAGLDSKAVYLAGDEPVIEVLRERKKYILSESDSKMNGRIRRRLDELDAALVIPLLHQKDLTGILTLGGKKSDEDFTQDDIDILLPLARTLAIAITNARLFEQLSESQAQAAQREKMAVIGTLSAGINHEICNPLGIARGQCEMFLLNLKEGIYAGKSPEDLLEKAEEIMRKVINETDRATVITRKLSSFAKPARGRIEDGVDVAAEMEEIVSLVEHELKLENITIERDISDTLPCIQADTKQIQEIFFNIIRNAAQSIKDEGTITFRAGRAGSRVKVEIEDTGSGIDGADLDQIFNPFFTTKEPGKGTGLGLFIVKQIVERNGGTI
ncbi:MAG: GAF domain-containing protein, partial [Candidatus Omnitrophica bacterium]|nr:GAF domain-containing protein [Candidatus Omnitrophota bacterium]